jgi:riboflavin kinase
MRVKGVVFSGSHRGSGIISAHFYRLINLLGYEPFMGTMNVKLERKIDIKMLATKRIENRLQDGSNFIDAYLVPVGIVSTGHKEEKYECWAMEEAHGIYPDDVVELVAKDNLKEKLNLEDGIMIELEFPDAIEKKEKHGFFKKRKER